MTKILKVYVSPFHQCKNSLAKLSNLPEVKSLLNGNRIYSQYYLTWNSVVIEIIILSEINNIVWQFYQVLWVTEICSSHLSIAFLNLIFHRTIFSWNNKNNSKLKEWYLKKLRYLMIQNQKILMHDKTSNSKRTLTCYQCSPLGGKSISFYQCVFPIMRGSNK